MILSHAHLVGNGKCSQLFAGHSGTVVACNVPKNKSMNYDFLSIIDLKVCLYLDKNRTSIKPVTIWSTEEVKNWAEQKNLPGKYESIYVKRHRWNSGHLAAEQLAKKFKNIHMWGMDSMFTDDLTSEMDDRVARPKRPPLNKEWRPNWTKLFTQAKDTNFIVHIPKGMQGVDYAENCRYEYHQT